VSDHGIALLKVVELARVASGPKGKPDAVMKAHGQINNERERHDDDRCRHTGAKSLYSVLHSTTLVDYSDILINLFYVKLAVSLSSSE